MGQFQSIIDRAEQRCKEHGARLTVKRKQVLFSLLKSARAMSAYELIEYYQVEFDASLPAMSVYRILEFLEGQELIHKLNLANKYVACTHIACHHDHEVPQFVICDRCSAVKEITLRQETLAQLKANIESVGFTLVSPQLEMNCICNLCLANSN